jgi:general secretion pathway protein M
MGRFSNREVWLIWGLGFVLMMTAIYQFAFLPALEQRKASLMQLAKLDALSAALDQLPSASNTLPEDGRPLAQKVVETASAQGLSIRRLAPEGQRLSISLNDAAFEDVVLWISALPGLGARVSAVEMARLPQPGQVTTRLTLEGL